MVNEYKNKEITSPDVLYKTFQLMDIRSITRKIVQSKISFGIVDNTSIGSAASTQNDAAILSKNWMRF